MLFKERSKFGPLAVFLVVVCIFVWPVYSEEETRKSITEEETSNKVTNISTSDTHGTKLTKSPLSDWFGSLFDSPVRVNKMCDCKCGEANNGPRIVGGKSTQSNEYPWMARLLYYDRFYCGGTLINDRYVLTAAHCTKTMWFMVKVTFGDHDTCNSGPSLETRNVGRSISRRSIFNVVDNDIALLRLTERVPFKQFIRPICLPQNKHATYDGSLAIVAGWGALSERGQSSCTLQQVAVPILSHSDCTKHTNYQSISVFMSENMICAGYPKGGYDSCQGDSGGPLFLQRSDKRYEIVGVVSWGMGCARPNYPGVYTRVTKYIDWILQNTRDGCYCQD